jgi:DNA-binding NtrC family response regulator
MDHAKTIAMAQDLLAEGRGDDVVRMVDPLLDPIGAPAADTGQLLLRALRAKVSIVVHETPGDALDLLPPRAAVADLCTCVRADVTLWHGWAHALRNEEVGEATQALRLLDSARELHASIHDASGQCWALLGTALAYASLDEYAALRQVLNEADPWVSELDDGLAKQWLHRLHLPALRAQGALKEALQHVDALRSTADPDDRPGLGAALSAYEAVLYDEIGRAPSAVLETADRALAHLARTKAAPQSPFFLAHRARVAAHLRQGDEAAARAAVAAAERSAPEGPVDVVRPLRADVALRSENGAADLSLTDLLHAKHPLPRGLSRAELMRLHGALLGHRDRPADARTWLRRAERTAIETGDHHTRRRTRLSRARLALSHDEPDRAQSLLSSFADDASSSLPLLTRQFALQGDAARARGNTAAAHRADRLARTGADLLNDRSLLDDRSSRLDSSEDPATESLLALLPAAAASTRLTAALCLRAVASLAPNGWVGLARTSDDAPPTVLYEHGTRPETRFSDTQSRWLPLPTNAPQLTLGLAFPAEATPDWDAIRAQVDAWIPAMGLALDRARSSTSSPPAPSAPDLPVIAQSAAMQNISPDLRRACTSRCSVLLTGEDGTGKAHLARLLHQHSPRADGPFEQVALSDLQHIPAAERLFGPGPDAPPGAVHAADGGTLLIEDVETLPLSAQTMLLHLLDTGTVPPQGHADASAVDVRVIATTEASLDEQVQNGHFRPDLRDRLRAVSLTVPPLRDRRADLPFLARRFLDTMRPDGAAMASITQPALEALLRYDWPGNVRQLRNEIERVLVHVRSDPTPTVDLNALGDPIVEGARRQPPNASAQAPDAILHPNQTLSDVLSQTETAVIERVLEACDGQVTASADVLGLTRQGLYKKMKRLGIDASEYQPRPEPTSSTS